MKEILKSKRDDAAIAKHKFNVIKKRSVPLIFKRDLRAFIFLISSSNFFLCQHLTDLTG